MINSGSEVRAHLAAIGCNGQEISRAQLAAIGCNGLIIILVLESDNIVHVIQCCATFYLCILVVPSTAAKETA